MKQNKMPRSWHWNASMLVKCQSGIRDCYTVIIKQGIHLSLILTPCSTSLPHFSQFSSLLDKISDVQMKIHNRKVRICGGEVWNWISFPPFSLHHGHRHDFSQGWEGVRIQKNCLQTYVKKGKIVPVLNYLSTSPWRLLGECMYRSIFSWSLH
jgi:hypothetical protein